jgi:hypothetical protein
MCAGTDRNRGIQPPTIRERPPFREAILVLVVTQRSKGNWNGAWCAPWRKSSIRGPCGRPCDSPDTGPRPSFPHHEDKLDRRCATDHEGESMLIKLSACIRWRRIFLFLSVGPMFLSRRLSGSRLVISHRYGYRHAEWQAFVNHKAPQLESGSSPRSADRRDRMTIGSVWRHRADSFWKADTA